MCFVGGFFVVVYSFCFVIVAAVVVMDGKQARSTVNNYLGTVFHPVDRSILSDFSFKTLTKHSMLINKP